MWSKLISIVSPTENVCLQCSYSYMILINEYESNAFRVYPRIVNSSNICKVFEMILYLAAGSKKQVLPPFWKPEQKIAHKLFSQIYRVSETNSAREINFLMAQHWAVIFSKPVSHAAPAELKSGSIFLPLALTIYKNNIEFWEILWRLTSQIYVNIFLKYFTSIMAKNHGTYLSPVHFSSANIV